MPKQVACLLFSASELYFKKGDISQAFQVKSNIWKNYQAWDKVQTDLLGSIKSLCSAAENEQDKVQWLIRYAAMDLACAGEIFEQIEEILKANFMSMKLEMPKSLVTVQCRFTPKSVEQYTETKLELTLQSHLPVAFNGCRIGFLFSDASYNIEYPEVLDMPPEEKINLTIDLLVKSEANLDLNELIIAYEPVPMSSLAFSLHLDYTLEVIPPSPKVIIKAEYSQSAYIGEEHVVKLTLVPTETIVSGKLMVRDEHTEMAGQRRASIDRPTSKQYLMSYKKGTEKQEYTSEIPIASTDLLELDLITLFYEEANYNFKIFVSCKVRNARGCEYTSESEYELDLNVMAPFQANFKTIQLGRKGMIVSSFWVQKHLSRHISLHSFGLEASNWTVKNSPHMLSSGFQLSETNILSHSFEFELSYDCLLYTSDAADE